MSDRQERVAARCPECKAPIGEIHTFGCSLYPEVMRENIEQRRGPLLDPLAMPPEELARLKSEGYGHLIAKPRRMDDVPGYRRDW